MNENLKKFISMINEEQKKVKQTSSVPVVEPIVEQTLPEPSLSGPEMLAARLSRKPVDEKTSDPLSPLGQNFVTFKDMNDHYSLFLQRIQQQLSSLGGGGEVKFARLDDINASTAGQNKFLTYNPNTRKFEFGSIIPGEGIELDSDNSVSLSVATETTLGGIKLGPGVELNGLDQIVINSEGLDFSFGDFFAYVANGAANTPAAYLSSLNDNQDIVIQSNGAGQVDIIGRFGIYPPDGPISSRDPVFFVDDNGDISATTLNITNTADLGLVAPLNVSINEQGLTKTPAIVTGSVAQFTGRDNRTPIIVLDSYGVDATRNITGGEFVFRSGRGANQTPAAIQRNDILGNITAAGWANTGGYGGVGVGGIRVVADENFTNTSRGSRVEIYSTPKGTITPTRIVTIGDEGLTFNEHDVTGIQNVDYIQFDTTHVDSSNTEGVLSWSVDDNTLNIHHDNGVTQQVGQEVYGYVRNGTANTIANGVAVQFSGAETDGQARLLVAPMLANGVYPNLYGLGVTTQSIAPGEDGMVTVWGKVRGINTSAWDVGDILYVSPTVTGGLTNVKPTAPNNVIPLAAVLSKDATQGEIFVRPTIEQKYSYGSFIDNQNHVANTANTPYAIPVNTTEFSSGVFVDPQDSTSVKVVQSGLYNFQFSTQFVSTNSSSKDIYIWARKNGADVPYSATRITLVGNNVYSVAAWNFVLSMSVNDRFQLMWATTDTAVSITSPAATAFAPSIPSTILTVTQVAQ